MSEPAPTEAPARKKKSRRVNVRRPDVMLQVQEEVETHYRSSLVERLRQHGSELTLGNTTVRLAKQFGFCYGVERAIDLAYAARKVFPQQTIHLIGEIIHNPEVNDQLDAMGIRRLEWRQLTEAYEQLGPDDVVIVPAFGAPTSFMDKLDERGCVVVDTTCGDVMSVWRRVRGYAKEGVTSIIHGKKGHEETRATASRAQGDDGNGHFVVVLTLAETDRLCAAIRGELSADEFQAEFGDATSPGFRYPEDLRRVGVANQTTMLKSETQEVQRRVGQAILARDGSQENFRVFDTICGATQERQDALFEMLDRPLDLLLVVGGYNSSNTTHLVEIGEDKGIPTFFIRNAACIDDLEAITHFDLHQKREIRTEGYAGKLADRSQPVVLGITAGASCPSNLIEETITRLLALRGIDSAEISAALPASPPAFPPTVP